MLYSTGTRDFTIFPDDVCGYAIRQVEAGESRRYLSAAHALVLDDRGLLQIGPRISPPGDMFGPEIWPGAVPADILGRIRREIAGRDHLSWLGKA